MGYRTSYNLEIITLDNSDKYKIIEDLRESNEDAKFSLDEDGSCADTCKWYDHIDDISEFSKKYPQVIFILNGHGEETGDIWVEYYKNGKSEHSSATITFNKCTLLNEHEQLYLKMNNISEPHKLF